MNGFRPQAQQPGRSGTICEPLQQAMVDLCYERGFREIEVGELCRRAGCPEAEFVSRYKDLEGCFAAAYERYAEEFLALMISAFDADLSWRRQIRTVARTFLAYLQEDPARAHFTVVDSLNAGEQAQLIRDRVFAGLFALIDQGRNEPGAPPSLTEATAEAVGGGVFGQVRILVAARRFEELPEMVPVLMYAVVLPYLGPEAAADELTIGMASPSRAGGAPLTPIAHREGT
jgi:AcrR family transcriptional regulator